MSGRLIGVGVGPGDPGLLTLNAIAALNEADIVAHFAKAGNASNARTIAASHLKPGVEELALLYPVTTEIPRADAAYREALAAFYDASASAIAARLDEGRVVAVIAEGDPSVLRLLHASPCAARPALPDRDRRRRDRHVGLLVLDRDADRPRRRRVHRAPGDAPRISSSSAASPMPTPRW